MIVPKHLFRAVIVISISFFQVHALPQLSTSPQATLQQRATIYVCPEHLTDVVKRVVNSVGNLARTALDAVAASALQDERNAPLRNIFALHFGTNNAATKLRVWQRFQAVRHEAGEDPGRLPIMCYDIEGRCADGTSSYLDRTETVLVLCPVWFLRQHFTTNFNVVDQVSLLFQQMLLARQLSFGALGIEMPLLDRPDIWEHVPEEERVNNSLAYVLFAKNTTRLTIAGYLALGMPLPDHLLSLRPAVVDQVPP